MAIFYTGMLRAHRDWVTALACPPSETMVEKRKRRIIVISASRDKVAVAWGRDARNAYPYTKICDRDDDILPYDDITQSETSSNSIRTSSTISAILNISRRSTLNSNGKSQYVLATPYKRYEGHSGFISDIAISTDGRFMISSSWDGTMKKWDLISGNAIGNKFQGHKKDVMSVSLTPDNQFVVSGSRDCRLKLWKVSTQQAMYSTEENPHTDWVSSVRVSPNVDTPVVVSGSWDGTVKVWSLKNFKCMATFPAHYHMNMPVYSVAVSPDGSLAASVGKGGLLNLWDIGSVARKAKERNWMPPPEEQNQDDYDEMGRSSQSTEPSSDNTAPTITINVGESINQVIFSPTRFWICIAVDTRIRIYDMETLDRVAELVPEIQDGNMRSSCTSMAWSVDGRMLFSGYSDNIVRVWSVSGD